jgi:hypothetical protein
VKSPARVLEGLQLSPRLGLGLDTARGPPRRIQEPNQDDTEDGLPPPGVWLVDNVGGDFQWSRVWNKVGWVARRGKSTLFVNSGGMEGREV